MDKTKNADAPVVIRYPNRTECEEIVSAFYPDRDFDAFGIRGYQTEDADVFLVTYGSIVTEALDASRTLGSDGIRLGIFLLEELKPYDRTAALLSEKLAQGKPVIFLEEGICDGGASMLLAERLKRLGRLEGGHRILAIRDHFASPEERCDLYAYCEINCSAIVRSAKQLLSEKADKN
jgi:deoxyxylulose-5-phosphate synthase